MYLVINHEGMPLKDPFCGCCDLEVFALEEAIAIAGPHGWRVIDDETGRVVHPPRAPRASEAA